MFLEQITSIAHIKSLLTSKEKLQLGEQSIAAILKSHAYINQKINTPDTVIYGINTGFGSLCNTVVPNKDLSQ